MTEKTPFSINGGKYEFCRIPFRLKNAGSLIQRAIDDVLREQLGTSMKVSSQKTHFFKQSGENLGFIVSNDGAETDPEKVKAIEKYPESTRSFLVPVTCYRCFVKDFAAIASL